MKPNTPTAMIVAIALVLTAPNLVAKERQSGQTLQGSPTLAGAGSTFIAPLVEQWIEDYHTLHPEVGIDYDAVGSGEGVDRFVAGTVDFAASDGGMSDAQVASVARGVRFVPATIGGVVLAYHIKGVKAGLKLTREAYTDIFLGNIRTWDDPKIQSANPDLPLPHETIVPVVRQDSSGTTFAFTNHLSAISEAWRRGPGVGTRIDWPGQAMAARGNEGVAGRIKVSEGSIGYVEYGFAQRLGLPMAALQNRTGQFVAPEAPKIAKVFEDTLYQTPVDLRLFVPDPSGDGVYPIVTYSWLLLYGQYPDVAKGRALKDFVRFGLTQGQTDSGRLGYVPLPGIVSALARQAVDTVQ
jgi:phosphate transport system substrate-binding protein